MALLSDYLRRSRFKRVEPFIAGRVLDLGCGRATGLALGGDRVTEYTGVDYNGELVGQLRDKFPEHRFEVRHLDDDDLALGQRYDCVLMIALIEHLFNQKQVMQQVAEHLAPGGRVVLTTPTPLGNDVVHRLGATVGLFAASAMDDHIVIYNRKRFELLAREIGLEIEHYEGFQLGCNQLVVLRKPEA